MIQLELHPTVSRVRKFNKTRKNEALMKQCFRDVYKMGMVWEETIQKVEKTDYLKSN